MLQLQARAIGVVLMGNLNDGTSGLWAIKDQGASQSRKIQQRRYSQHASECHSACRCRSHCADRSACATAHGADRRLDRRHPATSSFAWIGDRSADREWPRRKGSRRDATRPAVDVHLSRLPRCPARGEGWWRATLSLPYWSCQDGSTVIIGDALEDAELIAPAANLLRPTLGPRSRHCRRSLKRGRLLDSRPR